MQDGAVVAFMVLLAIVGIPLVVVLAKLWGFHVGGRRFESLEDFVARTSAHTGLEGVAPSGFFSSFADTCFHGQLPGGRRARVRYEAHTHSNGKTSSTYYTVHLAVATDPAVSLSVKREGLLDRFGAWLGLVRDMKIGDDGFDSRFWIKSPLEERALRAFDRGFKFVVATVFDRYGARGLEVSNGWIEMTALESAVDPYDYLAVLHALEEGARSFDRVPIEVSVLGGTRRAFRDAHGATRCSYCHGTISGAEPDLVACDRCHTVLHDECWRELGRCPLMGCAGRTPERARAGAK